MLRCDGWGVVSEEGVGGWGGGGGGGVFFFFFQAEDGIRDRLVTGVQTCALPICQHPHFHFLQMPSRVILRRLMERSPTTSDKSEILSFGILLESRRLSAQITLTSELLRFL